ncbi:hypothetical protein FHS42_005265 [Streptomyces zagrosensis]|uniref:Uncharacterized protein n=1 Tax=Streptomyces zagrosensis TaxID=1042984 RepID=A0A7W9V0S6_9ACTN|nr:hypothetical protein [Streptomyces zagrosensis]
MRPTDSSRTDKLLKWQYGMLADRPECYIYSPPWGASSPACPGHFLRARPPPPGNKRH